MASACGAAAFGGYSIGDIGRNVQQVYESLHCNDNFDGLLQSCQLDINEHSAHTLAYKSPCACFQCFQEWTNSRYFKWHNKKHLVGAPE